MRSAEIVIVGAGVVGASIAHHLALRGCRDVLVLERHGAPGQGSTAVATGGFRAQFGSEINVRLSLLSHQKLLAFEEETGVGSGYDPVGYLFLATRLEHARTLGALLQLQRRAGLQASRLVEPDEIGELNPHIERRDVLCGSFCSIDGFIEPLEILRGYVESAKRRGVCFEYDAGWVELRTLGNAQREVVAVRSQRDSIATRCVINAGGAWAALLGRPLDVDIPVRPLRRQVGVTEPFSEVADRTPLTVDLDDGFHFRKKQGRVVLLRPDEPQSRDPFDTTLDANWLDEIMPRAERRVPCLKHTRIDRSACRAGLYEMTPDGHAILGRMPGVDGLYVANGFSGHGVMHAPITGQLLAEIILDGEARTLNVLALGPERFAAGQPIQSFDLL